MLDAFQAGFRQPPPPTPPFTCPRCAAVSHNPADGKYGYCARCNTFPEQREQLAAAERKLLEEDKVIVDLLRHGPVEVDFIRSMVRNNGYLLGKALPNDRWGFLMPLAYTIGLGVSRIGDTASVDKHWCFPKDRPELAFLMLILWDGAGDPGMDWIREPGTGRRIAQEDGEIDENGNEVAKGTLYVRL